MKNNKIFYRTVCKTLKRFKHYSATMKLSIKNKWKKLLMINIFNLVNLYKIEKK